MVRPVLVGPKAMLRALGILVAISAFAAPATAATTMLDLPEGDLQTQLCHKGEKDDVCAIVAQYNAFAGLVLYYAVSTACQFDLAKACDVA